MESTWNEYRDWLKAHFPEGFDVLNPGANERQLSELESIVGAKLPDDYRQWLAIHNGQEPDGVGILCSQEFLSTTRIVEEWRTMTELADNEVLGFVSESQPPHYIRPDWWNRLWIPITSDQSGNLACLDLNPGPAGAIGQVIDFDHETVHRAVMASSFRDWVREYVDAVLAGGYAYSDDFGRFMPTDEI